MKTRVFGIFFKITIASITVLLMGYFFYSQTTSAKIDSLINSSTFAISAGNDYNPKDSITVGNAVGNKAPEITLKNPKDSIISLSSLKGKLVLIDFWASWCGPCRNENPNIVAAYKKYKDAKFEDGKTSGFSIFSISLDKDKFSWINAINKDSLEWPYHVSDLKVWNSEVLKKYNVSLIPANFLMNKDGIIIATNLRGAELEAELNLLMSK